MASRCENWLLYNQSNHVTFEVSSMDTLHEPHGCESTLSEIFLIVVYVK
jgi:hypothetical protein